MKLYEFKFSGIIKQNPISMVEHEVLETARTFRFSESPDYKWVAKDTIGDVRNQNSSLVTNQLFVYLTEPDFEKAKTLFLEELQSKIKCSKKMLDTAEKDYHILANISLASSLMTEDMYDELKKNVFFAGADAMVDILDHDLDFATDEEMMQALDNVLAQMPEEEAYKYYQKYCANPTLGR